MTTQKYKVKAGDSLWKISRQKNLDFALLASINGLSGARGHWLKVGQTLILPTTPEHDTELSLRILDVRFAPIKHARIKITHDGQKKSRVADANGEVRGILIDDHAKGLEVEFQTIDKRWIKIAHHKTVPLGRKRLVLTNRAMLSKGNYEPKAGAQQQSSGMLKNEVRQLNQDVHIAPATKPLPPKKALKQAEAKPLPQAFVKHVRTEGGVPTHVVAAIFTQENLHLSPANERYRPLIIATAKKFGLTPPTLAAVINAEAAKDKTGQWLPGSFNKKSKAAGLTQFLASTWLGATAKDPNTLVFARVQDKKLSDQAILDLRFDPELSIDASAAYAKQNLKQLQKSGIDVGSLPPEDLAKVIYAAHHEGRGGFASMVKGTFTEKRAKNLLPTQVGAAKATQLIKRFNDDARMAYLHWLFRDYIDGHINVRAFMVDPSLAPAPRSMEAIYQALGGKLDIPQPVGKADPKPPTKTPQTVAPLPTVVPHSPDSRWHDPLSVCVIRSAGLKKGWKGAIFRPDARTDINGKVRPHQGLDLIANPGTPIYAVADGVIVAVKSDDIGDYGRYIVLSVDVNDLPKQQKDHYAKVQPGNNRVFFMYAHLTTTNVSVKDQITVGQVLGTTGHSGNAKTMTTIAEGAHLHFEVRIRTTQIGRGLDGRTDPLPFLNHYSHP